MPPTKKTVNKSNVIGTSSSGGRSRDLSSSFLSLKSEKELADKVTAVMNPVGSIEEIQSVLCIVEERQKELEIMEIENVTIPKNSKIRLWNHQVVLRFQLIKSVQDIVGTGGKSKEKALEIKDSVVELSHKCFNSLISLPNKADAVEQRKVAELYERLSMYACQMGFLFQRRKMPAEALKWCDKAVDAHLLRKSIPGEGPEIRLNTQWLALLKAECFRLLGKPEEGLRWLTKEMATDPSYWEKPTVCYDVFEPIPWNEISTHWIALYKDAWTFQPEFNKTTLDFLEEEFDFLSSDSISSRDNLVSRVLRLELNSHFTTRHGVPSGMIAVGEALVEKSPLPFDNVLGFLAISIGFSFGDAQQVDHAVNVITQAAELIEEDDEFKLETNSDMVGFITALVSIWRGICILKSHQYFAESELSLLKEQFVAENPEKFKDRDTGEDIRGVSGLSMLNLDHESDWVCSLVYGIEMLMRFAESEEILKAFSNEFCPSLVVMTSRLAAYLLIAVGDPVNGVKAWHVVNKLAKVYEKKGLMVLSASEILKVLPDLEGEVVVLADKANAEAKAEGIKHNKAMSYRLSLGKSIACFKLQQFKEGVAHLLDVFQYYNIRDNFDATHHLMAEATFVLSWYRAVQFSHTVDLSGFPEALVKMSSAGIAMKAFKILGGMTRNPDIVNSGWTDLMHNYFVLSSLFEFGVYTLKVLRESGKTRELKCFLTDLVNFTQHCGFVSRTVSLIVPMISLDISARNFYHAQMKIDAIYQLYQNSTCPEEKEEEGSDSSYQKMIDNLKLQLTTQRLDCTNDLVWALKTIDVPSLYYKNRNTKVVDALKKDLRPEFDDTKFSFPSWMRHNLSCSCHICLHPHILPMAFTFFHVQTKYMNCMSKVKSAMAVLETTKLLHERTIFRLIHNLSSISVPLSVICSKKMAMKGIELIYTPFCVDPGLDALITQMTICPVTDIKIILNAMKKAVLIIKTLDPKDYIGTAPVLELGYSALYKYLIDTKQVEIKGTEIREILQHQLEVQETDREAKSPTTIGIYSKSVPPPKKGALKVTAKRIHLKETEIIEDGDRLIPLVPLINLESDEDETTTSSSSSTATISVSRGQPQEKSSERSQRQKTASTATDKVIDKVTERRSRRGVQSKKENA